MKNEQACASLEMLEKMGGTGWTMGLDPRRGLDDFAFVAYQRGGVIQQFFTIDELMEFLLAIRDGVGIFLTAAKRAGLVEVHGAIPPSFTATYTASSASDSGAVT